MSNDDFYKDLERKIKKNEEEMELLDGQFDYLVRQSYADESQAHAAMEAMSSDLGEAEVFHRLRNEPWAFGAAPASTAAAVRADEKRRLMPEVYARYQQVRDATDILRTTLQKRPQAQSGVDPNGQAATQQVIEQISPAKDERKRRLAAREEWLKKQAAEKAKNPGKQVGVSAESEAEPQ